MVGTMTRYVLTILLVLVSSSGVYAADRYVATTGNNGNDGTSGTPWLTVQYCINSISAGDTCIIAAGTYTETITFPNAGALGTPITVRSATSRTANIAGVVTIASNYIVLDGVKVTMPASTSQGINVTGNSVTITDVYVTSSSALAPNSMGIRAAANGAIIEDSLVEWVCFGIGVIGDQIRIDHNTIRDIGLATQCDDIDYSRFFGTNIEITRNTMSGVDMGDIGSAHVDCMQTYDATGDSSSGILIDSNFCADAHQGIMWSGTEFAVSSDATIRNNIFTRVTSYCALVADVADVHFYNNLCDVRTSTHGMWCLGSESTGTCEFKNNIVFGSGTLYGAGETASLIDGDAGAPGEDNLLYRSGSTLTGYADDIKNQDPLFTNLGTYDFTLTSSSPARLAGPPITGWTFALDYDGLSRPAAGNWDIGPYQFKGLPTAPTNVRIAAICHDDRAVCE
jgi:hypothetical protein